MQKVAADHAMFRRDAQGRRGVRGRAVAETHGNDPVQRCQRLFDLPSPDFRWSSSRDVKPRACFAGNCGDEHDLSRTGPDAACDAAALDPITSVDQSE
jgi:hypothetical protein